jgi:hypothetical protein
VAAVVSAVAVAVAAVAAVVVRGRPTQISPQRDVRALATCVRAWKHRRACKGCIPAAIRKGGELGAGARCAADVFHFLRRRDRGRRRRVRRLRRLGGGGALRQNCIQCVRCKKHAKVAEALPSAILARVASIVVTTHARPSWPPAPVAGFRHGALATSLKSHAEEIIEDGENKASKSLFTLEALRSLY